MKKIELRAEIDKMTRENETLRRRLGDLTREVETMREHWRPVPMMHEWQPRNPQCALCDEWRDAPRHRVDTHREEGVLDKLRQLHQPTAADEMERCRACIAGYDPRTGDLVFAAWPCATASVLQ